MTAVRLLGLSVVLRRRQFKTLARWHARINVGERVREIDDYLGVGWRASIQPIDVMNLIAQIIGERMIYRGRP